MEETSEDSYRCPECHTPVERDTPKCPGCGGLFQAGIELRRQELQNNPFDPRTEISADAIHIASRIVKHLWIIFVLLPFVAVVLWAILAALK
jgi:uncharacterized membrane protein YvbJ